MYRPRTWQRGGERGGQLSSGFCNNLKAKINTRIFIYFNRGILIIFEISFIGNSWTLQSYDLANIILYCSPSKTLSYLYNLLDKNYQVNPLIAVVHGNISLWRAHQWSLLIHKHHYNIDQQNQPHQLCEDAPFFKYNIRENPWIQFYSSVLILILPHERNQNRWKPIN